MSLTYCRASTYLHIDSLDDIQKDLILRVLGQGSVHADRLREGGQGRLGSNELGALLRDVCFEHRGLGGLGIAKVEHLVEQFICHHEVVANRLLFDALEVLFEHLAQWLVRSVQFVVLVATNLDQLVQEVEHHHSIAIHFGDSDDCQPISTKENFHFSFLIFK